MTSEWLLNQVFSILRQTKSSTQSQSGASSDQTNTHRSVPVCLASADSNAESVDYFLTKANEPISNFLSLDTPLKLCYATQLEVKQEKSSK